VAEDREIYVYNLGGRKELEAEMSSWVVGFTEETEAEGIKFAGQMIEDNKVEIGRRAQAFQFAEKRAADYEVKRTPAIVIDGDSPIYSGDLESTLRGRGLAQHVRDVLEAAASFMFRDSFAQTGPGFSDFTTADILAVAAAGVKSCLKYRVSGTCFFWVCNFGCYIVTTPQYTHNIPDLTVSTANSHSEMPWVEARALYGAIGRTAGSVLIGPGVGGGGFGAATNPSRGNMKYKSVTVIGNPATLVANALSGLNASCSSEAIAFAPYYLSIADAGFRSGGLDNFRPETYVPEPTPWPIHRHIGLTYPLNKWANIFPRTGFTQHTSDPVAGAIAAQRAISILLDDLSMRPKMPYGHGSIRVMGKIQSIKDGNEHQEHWQMISPMPQSKCEAFGQPLGWDANKFSIDGGQKQGWIYWTCYTCCARAPGKLITTVSWSSCDTF
ncbi:MAG: TraU family protein, partial [Pseudomonadales bacterium]